MTGQIFLVKSMIVDLDLGKCTKIVRHEHNRDGNMSQLANSMVDAPHEDGEQRVRRPVQFAFGVFDFDVLGLGRAQAHAGFARGHFVPLNLAPNSQFFFYGSFLFDL